MNENKMIKNYWTKIILNENSKIHDIVSSNHMSQSRVKINDDVN